MVRHPRLWIGSLLAFSVPLAGGASASACFNSSSSGATPDAGFMVNPDATVPDSGEAQDSSPEEAGPHDASSADAPAPSDGASGSDATDGHVADSATSDVDAGPYPLSGVVSISGQGESINLDNTAFCATLSDGSARCWGANGYGLTGIGAPMSPFQTVYATQPMGLSSGVTALAAGDDHACALQGGSTLCWGDNTYGQLGNGTSGSGTSVYVPTANAALAGATAIAAGEQVACAILGGSVKCWGANVTGNVGNGTTTLEDTPQATGVSATQIAVGGQVCAITPAGGVTCWGRNDYGQAGQASTSTCSTGNTACNPTPGPTSIASGATGIFIGAFHTCAIIGGVAKCWGDDRSGQLGDGNTNASVNATPVAVQGLAGTPLQLALSWQATCALIQGGTVQCWGDNTSGVLGVADAGTGSLTPVTVLTGATAIAGGDYSMCAVMSDTTVRCWGANGQGQLCDGSSDGLSHGPTPVLAP